MSPSKASEVAVSRPPGGREGGREGGRVMPVDSRSVNEYKEGHGGREGGREEEKEGPKKKVPVTSRACAATRAPTVAAPASTAAVARTPVLISSESFLNS